METKPKRPISVWIAQVILFICGLLASLSLVTTVLFMFSNAYRLGVVVFLFPIAFSFILAVLYFVGLYGVATRRVWGRWLSVAELSLILIGTLIGQLFRPSGSMQYYQYTNDAERFGGFIGSAIMFGLFLWLILHIALSKRVTEFFSPLSNAEALNDEPPPPPTFDN